MRACSWVSVDFTHILHGYIAVTGTMMIWLHLSHESTRMANKTTTKQSITKVIACFMRYVKNGISTLRPRQNGRHFPDDIFKWIFLNENVWISINISLKFVPRGLVNNIPTLVQVMAWRRPGDKPLSEPMMVRLPTHICVTRPQWVKLVVIDSPLMTVAMRVNCVCRHILLLNHCWPQRNPRSKWSCNCFARL